MWSGFGTDSHTVSLLLSELNLPQVFSVLSCYPATVLSDCVSAPKPLAWRTKQNKTMQHKHYPLRKSLLWKWHNVLPTIGCYKKKEAQTPIQNDCYRSRPQIHCYAGAYEIKREVILHRFLSVKMKCWKAAWAQWLIKCWVKGYCANTIYQSFEKEQ